jgi:hypothetical protein
MMSMPRLPYAAAQEDLQAGHMAGHHWSAYIDAAHRTCLRARGTGTPPGHVALAGRL